MIESTKLRSLFSDYASGEITSDRLPILEAALREDAILRQEFIEYLNIDSALGDLAALTEPEMAEFESEAAPLISAEPTLISETKHRRNLRSHFLLAIVTVAIPLLIGAISWLGGPENRSFDPVATLMTDVDALLQRDGQPWEERDLTIGTYELQRGLLHLRFAGGVTVYLEAPARFVAVSARRVVLHRGRLSANVAPEGTGFTVATPEAEVVDFGTEFSVDVEGDASEVHVFDGFVRVNPKASNQRKLSRPIDLQTSQAVRLVDGVIEPENIAIATDRFIRDFEEPKPNFVRAIKRLSPLAYYRMPIRDRGLVSEPSRYSGVVLTGEGNRPPHARGVFVGGSLRVGADSTGRGARVDSPPALNTGQFSLTAFVYLEAPARSGMVATNWNGERGNFAVFLDENGMLKAAVRSNQGDLNFVAGSSLLPLKTWRHFVVTANGEQLQLYEDGRLTASAPCADIFMSDSDTVWFGTNATATQVWDGRIDELALFNRALTTGEIESLYRTAQEEIARSK